MTGVMEGKRKCGTNVKTLMMTAIVMMKVVFIKSFVSTMRADGYAGLKDTEADVLILL